VAVVIGAIGPWQTTFIVDVAGTSGDGRFTLVMIIAAGFLALTRASGSGWLLAAAVLGIVCAIVGIADLISVNSSTQTLFGREVKLVSVGWGLWLTAIASTAFAIAAYVLWTEPSADEEPVAATTPDAARPPEDS
jgi:polyferredoxin